MNVSLWRVWGGYTITYVPSFSVLCNKSINQSFVGTPVQGPNHTVSASYFSVVVFHISALGKPTGMSVWDSGSISLPSSGFTDPDRKRQNVM